MDVKLLIANALTMDEGDCVVIPTLGDRDAESIRTRLYKARDTIPAGKHLIQIKKRSIHLGPPNIYLERTGSPVEIPAVKDLQLDANPDMERIVKLALEDGYSLKEILAIFPDAKDTHDEVRLIFKRCAEEQNA